MHLFHLFPLSSFLSTSVCDQARRSRGIGRVFNRQEEGERLEKGHFTHLSIEACQDEAVLASETRM